MNNNTAQETGKASWVYRHHKYTWSKPFGTVRHWWELIGPHGALHFHVSIYSDRDGYSPTAGLEIHYCAPPEYMANQAPSHIDCPLTGGRCWHDGTSLYASEQLWPSIEPLLERGDHEAIFKMLEQEADNRFSIHPPNPTAIQLLDTVRAGGAA